jgi:hypothetical protein
MICGRLAGFVTGESIVAVVLVLGFLDMSRIINKDGSTSVREKDKKSYMYPKG